MRRSALSFLLCALTSGAFAADFRLVIDAPAAAVAHARAIRVYGLKLGRQDRIVAIAPGKGEGSAVHIVLDSKPGAGKLLGEIKGSGFNGKLIQASGDAPKRTLSATLTKIVPGQSEGPGLLSAVAAFFTSTVGLVTVGALGLLAAVFFLLRSKPKGESPALPNRRKSIDESLKDLQKRLEKIDENQHQLVKKPPMLRSFSKQIHEFDARLGSLESSLRSLQASLLETGKTLAAFERGQVEVRAKLEANSAALSGVSDTVADTSKQVGSIDAALTSLVKETGAHGEAVLSKLSQNSMEVQSRLAALERTGEASAEAHRLNSARLEQVIAKEPDFGPLRQEISAQLNSLPGKEDLEPLHDELKELQGFVGWLRDEQRSLSEQVAEVGRKEVDLEPLQMAIEELREQVRLASSQPVDLGPVQAQLEELTVVAKQKTDLTPLEMRVESVQGLIAALPYDTVDIGPLERGLGVLESQIAELAAALGSLQEKTVDWEPLLREVKALRPADTTAQLQAMQAAHEEVREKLESLDGQLSAVAAVLEEGNPQMDSLAVDQKHLCGEIEKLQQSLAEIGSRTDQRESLLLSLQSRMAESETGQTSGAEVLPLVADLRLEMQALATEQARAMDSLGAIAHSLHELQSAPPSPSFDASLLETELKRLSAGLDDLRSKEMPAPVLPEFDLAPLEEELKQLASAVQAIQSRSEEPATFDAGALEAELRALSESVEGLRVHTATSPVVDMQPLEDQIKTLAGNLERWVTEQNELTRELHALRGDVERQRSEIPSPATQEHGAVSSPESEAPAPAELEAVEVAIPSQFATPEVSPSPADGEEPAIADVVEATEEDSETAGWALFGGSRSRRWSTQVEAPAQVVASEKALTPLTPTVTPDSEYPVGPMLYVGKKVLYGHGNALRSTWPGKSASSASLQEPIPADPWRLAFLDGHIFCVEDGQVEVVSVASWHVVARFSGDFVDHTATQTHWVGLGSALGRLYVDHRNLQGRLLGEPVQLPIDSEDGVGLVTDKERVFVGSRDGRIFKVELGKCSEIASVKNEGLRLKSLSVVKSGLLALFAGEQDDQLRRFGFDGKALRQTELGFVSSVDHPVVMGDRAYLVDSAAGKLVAVGLKKGEVMGTVPLPFEYVRQFSGFCNGDRHSLLLIAGQDEGSAKVWLVDAESGDLSMVCEANQKHVEAMLADGRVVVSSSNSYQNSLRVFDPFGLESQRRAA